MTDFVEVLPSFKKLRSLDLRGNQLGGDSATILSSTLKASLALSAFGSCRQETVLRFRIDPTCARAFSINLTRAKRVISSTFSHVDSVVGVEKDLVISAKVFVLTCG